MDKVLLVTGGSRGIGAATCLLAARQGWAVAVNYSANALAADAVVREVHAAGGRAMAVQADVADESQVLRMFGQIDAQLGRLTGLVNNAGVVDVTARLDTSARGWDAVVRNNLTGGFLVARECYTQWMAQHGGAIVNIIADIWMGMPGMGHSGAARAGMLNFTETAALEWGPVRVNAVAPGWIASSGMDQYPPEMTAQIRGMGQLVPVQRMGTESEVSAAIVFLLSEAAAFVSGACLRVDGAAPNAKRIWPQVGTGGQTSAFNGFHLATTPRVLQDLP